MKIVPLTQGFNALVDDEDYERVTAYKWHVQIVKHRNGTKTFYAARALTRGGPKQMMHVFLKGFKLVDHKDRNGLNNQKTNLRHCNVSQNLANRRAFSGKKSPFKGVDSARGKWRARITKDGRRFTLGFFFSQEEAANAYNRKALELFGEFAWLNTFEDKTTETKNEIEIEAENRCC